MMKIKTFASGSSGNLHLLDFGSKKILIECGLPMSKIKKHLDFDLNIDACLLSHYHGDHSKSAQKVMEAGINLYCRQETADFLKLTGHRLKVIKSRFEIGDINVFCFKTDHDTLGAVGFLISYKNERTLFATDTGSLPYKFPGLTQIMIECNFSTETITEENEIVLNRTRKTHMSLERTLDFLKRNDLSLVKEIHLIHLSNKNGNPEIFKRAVQVQTGKIVIVA